MTKYRTAEICQSGVPTTVGWGLANFSHLGILRISCATVLLVGLIPNIIQHAISHFTPPTLIHSQTILLALLAQIKIVIVMMEKQLVFSEYFIFKTLTLKKYIGGVGS